MTFVGPGRVIDLGAVSTGGQEPSAPRRIDRRTLRRLAVALLAVLCAVTLTGSVIPRSHGARLLWTIPYTDQAFALTGDSLYLQTNTDGWSLRAYELADGSLRWTKRLAGPASIRLSAAGDVLLPVGVRAGAPESDDGNAAGRLTRATVALDAATGTERWRVTGEVAFSRGERAVVVDRYRRTGDLAALAVVRLTDGGTVWTRAAEAELQWTADDDNLLTVEARPSVTAYSLPTMRRRWSIDQGLRDRCQASGTRVVCPRTNSTLSVIDVG